MAHEEQDTIDGQATRDLLVYSAAGRGDVSLLEFLLKHGFHYNEEYLAQDATGAVIEWLLERTPRTQNSEVVRPLLLAAAKEGRADLIARIAAGVFLVERICVGSWSFAVRIPWWSRADMDNLTWCR